MFSLITFHKSKTLLAGTVAALALVMTPLCITSADAAGQGGSAKGQGAQGQGGQGQGGAYAGGQRGRSMTDIFRDVTGEADDDSDRPEWAGQPGGKDDAGGGRPATSGSKKGDVFGDLFVILRDANGIPILTAEGWVQPLDADGNLIPLDDEGHPVDESLTVEVELGRLNVGRAPTSVTDRRAEEVIDLLMAATEIKLDPAGRLILTVDGEEKTIDSPLENLALYMALVTDGTIPGITVDDLVGTSFDFMVDGVYTIEDLDAAKAFLAAATDKTSAFTTDEIAYIDAFLGINLVTVGDVAYSVVDYSAFTYDRSDTFDGVMTTVLIEQSDGSWLPTEIDVYDVVFDGIDITTAGTLEAYTQAAEDARVVIEYIHEYALPTATLTTSTTN